MREVRICVAEGSGEETAPVREPEVQVMEVSQPVVGRTIQEEMRRTPEERMAEYRAGGTLSPCPVCGTKRFQRSDYIRCHLCGINWMEGENLDGDPRNERYRKMVASAAKPARPEVQR